MKLRTVQLGILSLTMGIFCGSGCSSSTTTSATTDAPSNTAAAPTEAPAQESGLVAGAYCYALENESLSLSAEMDYDGSSKVKGTLWGDIHDKPNDYFAGYSTTFEGVRNGDKLEVTTVTEIEGDVQEEKETYIWDGATLTEGPHKMTQVDCEPHD